MAPRWRKAIADIVSRPGRSALAVLAMGLGIWALSTLAFKQAILRPVLDTMHGATEPASSVLHVDRLDDDLVRSVRAVPGVGKAEARPVILARLRIGRGDEQEWIPALLYVVRDFDDQAINLFQPDSGVWPPADDQILLERSAVGFAGVEPGDALTLRIPGGGERSLTFTGTVHAQGLAPAWMEHVVYGFVSWTSLVRDGGHRESRQLLLRVAEHDLEIGHIREVTDRVETHLESRGVTVERVDVPEPGRHVHAAQMNTFLYLVASFGVMAFLLSAVLVANMVQALQSEQVKQVGQMKAVGATTRQIACVYLAHVGLLAATALCLGLPLGWITGTAYARFSAGILNADVSASPVPWLVWIAVAVVGVAVPVAVALFPVWRASRITVREALSDAGVRSDFGSRGFDRMLLGVAGLPRPLALMLRTTFARRGRLALTVGMLAIGGAMFLAALNVADGWSRAADADFARRHYDLVVGFPQPQPIARIDSLLTALQGVAAVEHWPSVRPDLVGESGAAGEPVVLLGLDPTTRLLVPNLGEGTWLNPKIRDGVVINHVVQSMHPTLAVGDTLSLRLEGRTLRFPVLGTAKDLLAQPLVYTPRDVFFQVTGLDRRTSSSARIVTHDRSNEGQLAAAQEIERVCRESGIEIAGLMRMHHMKGALLDHLVIIQVILTLGGTLVVVVGGIGLASTLMINVVQRTRELGILGAIGARPRTLALHLWAESMLIALTSWVCAVVLTAPISYMLEAVTGRMFFRRPLDFTMSAQAAALWLLVLVVLATLASIHPVRRGTRLTIREAIAHV